MKMIEKRYENDLGTSISLTRIQVDSPAEGGTVYEKSAGSYRVCRPGGRIDRRDERMNLMLFQSLILLAQKLGEPVETSFGTFGPDDLPGSHEKTVHTQNGPVTGRQKIRLSRNRKWTWNQFWNSGSVDGPGCWYIERATT